MTLIIIAKQYLKINIRRSIDMKKTHEELNLLKKLASGVLDGMVGREKVYAGYKNVYCGKYIKDGEPVSYREGESSRFFNGKENERTRKKGQNERQRKATDENREKRKGEETVKRSITAPPSLNVKTPS